MEDVFRKVRAGNKNAMKTFSARLHAQISDLISAVRTDLTPDERRKVTTLVGGYNLDGTTVPGEDFRFTPPPDGCCRSGCPGLCLFCCVQPLCVVSQHLFHNFPKRKPLVFFSWEWFFDIFFYKEFSGRKTPCNKRKTTTSKITKGNAIGKHLSRDFPHFFSSFPGIQ